MCYSWYERQLIAEKLRKSKEEAEAMIRKARASLPVGKPKQPSAPEKQPVLEDEVV